jgi:hypothetical protein
VGPVGESLHLGGRLGRERFQNRPLKLNDVFERLGPGPWATERPSARRYARQGGSRPSLAPRRTTRRQRIRTLRRTLESNGLILRGFIEEPPRVWSARGVLPPTLSDNEKLAQGAAAEREAFEASLNDLSAATRLAKKRERVLQELVGDRLDGLEERRDLLEERVALLVSRVAANAI